MRQRTCWENGVVIRSCPLCLIRTCLLSSSCTWAGSVHQRGQSSQPAASGRAQPKGGPAPTLVIMGTGASGGICMCGSGKWNSVGICILNKATDPWGAGCLFRKLHTRSHTHRQREQISCGPGSTYSIPSGSPLSTHSPCCSPDRTSSTVRCAPVEASSSNRCSPQCPQYPWNNAHSTSATSSPQCPQYPRNNAHSSPRETRDG
ncbi:uncharacterized protein LOC118242268 isoform X1 [Electrophorus electricus]|uniref:uncharacterized protein LOC118242268 isoform X1 n=1 Tax=Electrophorus electricus TaxID=8005 RepID=UPI0015D04367|nr:uncharacterized protein LOC118242268 isoform X1 [Electrophorus electricus]XP_035387947.1 uncharacterized protein LOC118242268 isoform X1 [Electrophorus electricus]XP_035387948.1 uncharacterized protein LOC118242268 isoform X1 [Electrophorus electricus]